MIVPYIIPPTSYAVPEQGWNWPNDAYSMPRSDKLRPNMAGSLPSKWNQQWHFHGALPVNRFADAVNRNRSGWPFHHCFHIPQPTAPIGRHHRQASSLFHMCGLPCNVLWSQACQVMELCYWAPTNSISILTKLHAITWPMKWQKYLYY